jgi:probable addiction module antidote protein
MSSKKDVIKKSKACKYEEWLIESLKDHDSAVAYLNAALEESIKGDAESQALLLLALRDVAEAQGGIAKIAKKAHLGRESLYKTLSSKGNPSLSTLTALAHAMGLELRFC